MIFPEIFPDVWANPEHEIMQVNKKIEQLIKDYQIIFGTDEGKRVLEDLKKRSHFYSTSHVKGDSHESAFYEGQRSLVVFIENLLNQKE